RSPIDGIVTKRHVDPGSPALPNQGTPLFVVARTDVLATSIPVGQSMASKVNPELPVVFQPIGDTVGRPIHAKVGRVAAEIEGGNLRVDIEVPNADGQLLPGSTGMATIMLEPPHEAITVPIRVLNIHYEGGRGGGFGGPRSGGAVCYQLAEGR